MMVILVKKGYIVICLKGGDLFVFGCGGEEVEELVCYNIYFEIIFGIILGIVVLVYVGILVIYCDYSFFVVFVIVVNKFGMDKGKYW